ncbi:hypothetical protein EV363DRAFT_1343660 [Boletus edulis]|uniref:Secreted protein n=1 Tax=Boletus edulis BED1 TaxID=1328754 RepID=A0AAD4G8C5_BOLED|nr:hypothetical protein EV363DRAFT_1343660 [Boletus edulis]KAF8424797.1 hypothetical protein L210DRAFT_3567818 [Boletus edulis BED1]
MGRTTLCAVSSLLVTSSNTQVPVLPGEPSAIPTPLFPCTPPDPPVIKSVARRPDGAGASKSAPNSNSYLRRAMMPGSSA